MTRNKGIAIACEEFGIKWFALCYLHCLNVVIPHPSASWPGPRAGDAQRIHTDVESSYDQFIQVTGKKDKKIISWKHSVHTSLTQPFQGTSLQKIYSKGRQTKTVRATIIWHLLILSALQLHMPLSWHCFPFPECFSALQQMEQKPYVKSSPLVCNCLE